MDEINQEISLKLLTGISELSEKTIIENKALSPLIFYYKTGIYHSVTVKNEDFKLSEIVSDFVKKGNISNYVYAEVIVESNALIQFTIVIDGIEYDKLYIGFKKVNHKIIFSDLIMLEEAQKWHMQED